MTNTPSLNSNSSITEANSSLRNRLTTNPRLPLFMVAIMVLVASACSSKATVAPAAAQDVYYVATNGDDADDGAFGRPFRTIQHALDTATSPGDRIMVRGGVYNEKIEFVASGDSVGGHIVLRNFPNETAVLDGTGVAGENMVYIENLHHLRFMGFEIRNNTEVTDGSGIRIYGYANDIIIRDNRIHEMRGTNAMGITVYGTSTTRAVSRLYIHNNEIYDCDPAPSEALTVNGNVNRFTISNNIVHDVNNIGIDAIGGETDINPDPTLVARSGTIRNNVVYNARSSYGGGFGAGIYVDGGKNIRVDNNVVYQCDLGIEIGAENSGTTTMNVHVRNNILHHNDKAGLVFGGYDSTTGRVTGCRFSNNTLFRNDLLLEGYGQIWVQYAENNLITNNIVWGSDSSVLLQVEPGAANNTLNYNLWNYEGGPEGSEYVWNGNSYTSFSDYQAQTSQGANSIFANPDFMDSAAEDFSLHPASPAVDIGTSRLGWYAPYDFDGSRRPQGNGVDMGAIEFLQN